MQKYIMNLHFDKTVILVADGEDTARNMHQKQNSQFLQFKFFTQKVYED
ncbi:hypothetical protein [Niallia nealsonii]|nr:hypothetical protein [Niallia nealsonii]